MSPGPAPAPIFVTPAQRAVLAALLRRSSCPRALALRVQIVLGAAGGQRTEPLARQLGCAPNTARKWRARWAAAATLLAVADAERPALERAIAAALADAPRPGTPATFTAEQLVQIINLACRPRRGASAPSPPGRPANWPTKRCSRASSVPSLPARWGVS